MRVIGMLVIAVLLVVGVLPAFAQGPDAVDAERGIYCDTTDGTVLVTYPSTDDTIPHQDREAALCGATTTIEVSSISHVVEDAAGSDVSRVFATSSSTTRETPATPDLLFEDGKWQPE